MRYRTIWISDIHLGTRACKAEQLKSFLKENDADVWYVPGDFLDFWQLKSSWYWPTEHSDILRLILKKAKEDRVIYIPGNHDEAFRPFCPLKFGNIDIQTYAIHETAKGEKVIVYHGDFLDAFVCNLKHVMLLGSIGYDLLIAANDLVHWIAKKAGFPYFSLAEYVKSKARFAINAIDRFERASANYAKSKGYHIVICGHLHTAADKQIDGIRYLNCGDWVSSLTAIVEDFDGNIKLINWKGEDI